MGIFGGIMLNLKVNLRRTDISPPLIFLNLWFMSPFIKVFFLSNIFFSVYTFCQINFQVLHIFPCYYKW